MSQSAEAPKLPPVDQKSPPRFVETFPSPEDWVALQGGKPRVFRHPDPHKKWIVLHVYEEHDDPAKRFQSGAVVETIPRTPEELRDKALSRLSFHRPSSEDGEVIERLVAVPSFMLRDVHGDECDTRSRILGGDPGRRILNQGEYDSML